MILDKDGNKIKWTARATNGEALRRVDAKKSILRRVVGWEANGFGQTLEGAA